MKVSGLISFDVVVDGVVVLLVGSWRKTKEGKSQGSRLAYLSSWPAVTVESR